MTNTIGGEIDDLVSPVWNEHNSGPVSDWGRERGIWSADLAEHALRSAQAKANLFFGKNKIPYRVKTQDGGRYVSLEKS